MTHEIGSTVGRTARVALACRAVALLRRVAGPVRRNFMLPTTPGAAISRTTRPAFRSLEPEAEESRPGMNPPGQDISMGRHQAPTQPDDRKQAA